MRPLDIDDVWPIASAGKPITAAVAMALVEEGRIGINQPVVDYIAELDRPEDADVLVHHLLTHYGGLGVGAAIPPAGGVPAVGADDGTATRP